MNTEEMFPRIGSFPASTRSPSSRSRTTSAWSGPNGLRQAMFLEKVDGFGRVILQQIKLHPGDAFLIFSSTGINGVVIEVALLRQGDGPARRRGDVARPRPCDGLAPPVRQEARRGRRCRHRQRPPGRRRGCRDRRACRIKVGPTSSIGAIAVVNMLKSRTAERLVELGVPPVVLTSPHFVGQTDGAEQLERVYEEYFRRVTRGLRPGRRAPSRAPESYE